MRVKFYQRITHTRERDSRRIGNYTAHTGIIRVACDDEVTGIIMK